MLLVDPLLLTTVLAWAHLEPFAELTVQAGSHNLETEFETDFEQLHLPPAMPAIVTVTTDMPNQGWGFPILVDLSLIRKGKVEVGPGRLRFWGRSANKFSGDTQIWCCCPTKVLCFPIL